MCADNDIYTSILFVNKYVKLIILCVNSFTMLLMENYGMLCFVKVKGKYAFWADRNRAQLLLPTHDMSISNLCGILKIL